MLSWWVGLSPEEFYEEVSRRKFGSEAYHPFVEDDPQYGYRVYKAYGRARLAQLRRTGFDIPVGEPYFMGFATIHKERKNLVVIPYYEWAESHVEPEIPKDGECQSTSIRGPSKRKFKLPPP